VPVDLSMSVNNPVPESARSAPVHTVYVCYFGLREPLVQTQVLPYLRELAAGGIRVSLLTFEPESAKRWSREQVRKEQEILAAKVVTWHHLKYHKWPSLPATLFDISVTGANVVFLNPPHSIEPQLVRQAFRGRDVRAFRIIRSTPLLWPCTGSGHPLPELPPGARAWFATHQRKLLARADQGGGPPWMVFRTAAARPGAKVVWADLSRTLTAAAMSTDDRRIPLNTCYVLHGPASHCLVIAAWLNSRWMRGLARLQADPARGGFARFNARTVGALPLPATLFTDPRLAVWASHAGSGDFLQAELDELTAPHLDLSPAQLRTLASMA